MFSRWQPQFYLITKPCGRPRIGSACYCLLCWSIFGKWCRLLCSYQLKHFANSKVTEHFHFPVLRSFPLCLMHVRAFCSSAAIQPKLCLIFSPAVIQTKLCLIFSSAVIQPKLCLIFRSALSFFCCFFHFWAKLGGGGGCTLYSEVPWVAPVVWKWQHVHFVSGKERETDSEAVAAEHSDDHSDPHRGW